MEIKGKNIDENRVPAQREDQGEKWMECMLDNDWNKAFDEQWNIMYAVPPSTSSKELKASFKNICRDLKCHSV